MPSLYHGPTTVLLHKVNRDSCLIKTKRLCAVDTKRLINYACKPRSDCHRLPRAQPIDREGTIIFLHNTPFIPKLSKHTLTSGYDMFRSLPKRVCLFSPRAVLNKDFPRWKRNTVRVQGYFPGRRTHARLTRNINVRITLHLRKLRVSLQVYPVNSLSIRGM